MIMQVPKILFVALMSQAFLKSASAAVEVFTNLADWEARVGLAAGPPCISIDDFTGPDIVLVAGTTDVGLFDVTIDAVTPNVDLGQIGGIFKGRIYEPNNLTPQEFKFHNFDNAVVIAIAADWVSTTSGADLTVTINTEVIKFSDYLTSSSGSGFLGFVDEALGIPTLIFGTESSNNLGEFFDLDDLRAAGRCPACPNGGCQGDPHFKTWRGQHFDYHGECDLVLIKSEKFESGLGLDVHIRTKIRHGFSFITSAALRIGKDLLEVESQGVYWLNGVLSAELPKEFSGFAFSHTQPTDKQHVFEIYLGGRERIKVKTYKDFVSVLVEQGASKHFGDSAGLMGDFRMGNMIARDGKTVIEDANAFGQEWQVLETEPSLFHTVRLPQHPQQVCKLPAPVEASQLRRRLSESSSVSQLAAEKACEQWGEGKDDCVFDVLTTGDLEMAVVGAY
jgi:hypothetical protein